MLSEYVKSKLVKRKTNNTHFKLNTNRCLSVSYGTLSKKIRPDVLYLRTRSRVMPIDSHKVITQREAEGIRENIQNCLLNTITLNPHFDNRCLVTVDMSTKNLSEGKRTFLRYDLLLRPIDKRDLLSYKLMMEMFNQKIEERIEKILLKSGYIFTT